MPDCKHFLSYQEVTEYLYGQLALFQKYGGKALNYSLDNIRLLCDKLNSPQKRYPTIHIGGTNGKGSTAHMLAAVFQAAGYTTGFLPLHT